jgi:hypothetical protein
MEVGLTLVHQALDPIVVMVHEATHPSRVVLSVGA